MAFYARLLAVTNAPAFHEGTWRLLEIGPVRLWDESYRHLVAWSWSRDSHHHLIVHNQSPATAHGHVTRPSDLGWPVGPWTNLLDPTRPTHVDASEGGVDIQLDAWATQLLGTNANQKGDA